MATVQLDTDPNLSSYVQTTTLDGRDYVLNFQWNQREAKWYLDVADQVGVPIRSGIKLVADWDLLRLVTDARKPPGTLMAMDTTGQGIDPGLHDLGSRVVMVYIEAE